MRLGPWALFVFFFWKIRFWNRDFGPWPYGVVLSFDAFRVLLCCLCRIFGALKGVSCFSSLLLLPRGVGFWCSTFMESCACTLSLGFGSKLQAGATTHRLDDRLARDEFPASLARSRGPSERGRDHLQQFHQRLCQRGPVAARAGPPPRGKDLPTGSWEGRTFFCFTYIYIFTYISTYIYIYVYTCVYLSIYEEQHAGNPWAEVGGVVNPLNVLVFLFGTTRYLGSL